MSPPFDCCEINIMYCEVLWVFAGVLAEPWSLVAGGLTDRYTIDDKIPAGSRAALWGKRFATRVTEAGLAVAAEVAKMADERQMSASQLRLADNYSNDLACGALDDRVSVVV